ncbi:MAG: methyltransferase [Verrucomicrobiota bacterium]
MKKQNAGKELYQQLRALPWERLWTEEVPQFDRATPKERAERVGLIRAVGVVFLESGPQELGNEVRAWLRRLLDDPEEKIRRYAVNALPKVGAGRVEESDLLALLQKSDIAREKKFLADALGKIGGEQTLAATRGLLPQTEQKARAAVARSESAGAIRMDRVLHETEGVVICLRGRQGLDATVRAEVEAGKEFRVLDQSDGLVTVAPTAPFSLADVYRLRCFGTAGFSLGTAPAGRLAELMASPLALRLFRTFTEGVPRYRIDFVSKGHQRAAVRELADRVYALCPEILNDPRSSLWAMDIHSTSHGEIAELRPRLIPDPRFAYRLRDIPAASHPPLAASMARLAGKMEEEIVWDPFCGSGVELIECALRGGVRGLFGTDLSAEAIAVAHTNIAAAGIAPDSAQLVCCDFREHESIEGLEAGRVSLIITNPPLGMRVPIPNLRQLIDDLFSVAAVALKSGGRLVFINPLRTESPHPRLKLQSRQLVDMSGFDCRMELYVKS